MNRSNSSVLGWWLKFVVAVLVLPIVPTGVVLALGWLLPGQVPWFYADASIPIGPLTSVATATYLLTLSNAPRALRALALIAIIFGMSFIARIELSFAQACVTQRGALIDLQRQQRDIQSAHGQNCD
jgi:hypothetical protein